jgi:hypothetical protein
LLQEAVVFSLQAFVELRISQGYLREAVSQLIFCPFEADEDVQFGKSRMVIDAIERRFEMSNENHYSISIEFGNFFLEVSLIDRNVLGFELF